MRTALPSLSEEIGHYKCTCGNIIGAWNGPYRLQFDPEDDQRLQ